MTTNKSILRFLTLSLAVACLLIFARSLHFLERANAQTPAQQPITYRVFDREVPLVVRDDAIAVSFKAPDLAQSSPQVTRGGGGEFQVQQERSPELPLYLQLQEDLQVEPPAPSSPTRGVTPFGGVEPTESSSADFAAPLAVQVSPLNTDYALVNFTSGGSNRVQERIEAQPYVETTLPVLARQGAKGSEEGSIVLPNEIILTLQPGLSDSEREAILNDNQLELLHPFRFAENRYLVRSRLATGLEVLRVVERLNSVAKIQSATPNFIQTLVNREVALLANESAVASASLLPMQWYLNSLPLSTCLKHTTAGSDGLAEPVGKCLQSEPTSNFSQPRVDIRAPEAWQLSNQGEGVTIAIIDSWIQWDRPDLAPNLYEVSTSNALPGEVHGWDFVENDPDTRISEAELRLVRPQFADSFLLAEAELRQKYPETYQDIQSKNAKASEAEVAKLVRSRLANQVAGDFHGTMVAGAIAARPVGTEGTIGVAPKATILPVRVMGINDSFSLSGYLEAIAYAVARGAEIVNISLGSGLPARGEIELISELLQKNPKLVIVAAAGNENRGQLNYPAAIDGVIAVGATNRSGYRAPYSNYGLTPNGQALTLVAPGGDNSEPRPLGRILTTGGTGLDAFWSDIPTAKITPDWGPNLDARGNYRWTTGTSFSSPMVAGAIALVKGKDLQRSLTRAQILNILDKTASYDGLKLTAQEQEIYQQQGKNRVPSANRYFFGSGLLNAEAAVKAVTNP
ncbi:S8 family serine peptidase [Oscillatoria sp. FACHB-1406]|uniref:S8 family serine peptidase n=1 Tax=Oscillatoria sp. FACHB-1406 TaxID=2692846 RepID=UPI0016842777|nr:S8 family serine peptidase [Oscillatoria sp. FACHB-1406]MBD2578330.1 S8 family serine peptidase [Oscillatoria sp. FACHB-1406]